MVRSSWKERRAGRAQWGSAAFPCLISAQGSTLGCEPGEVGAGPPRAQPWGPRGAAASDARRGQPAAAVRRSTSHPWLPRLSPLVPFQAVRLRRHRLPGALAACRPAFPLSPRALFNDEQRNESFALALCIHGARPVCAWPRAFSGSRGPGAPVPSPVHMFLLQPSCDSGW